MARPRTNLVQGDLNQKLDVFVYDQATATIERERPARAALKSIVPAQRSRTSPPSAGPSRSETVRAVKSEEPPAVNGTSTRIGREG